MEQNERLSYTCKRCGSVRVQHAAWVDSNSGEAVGIFGTKMKPEHSWCTECNEHVELLVEADGQEVDDLDGPACPYCEGDLELLGALGNTRHYCCRHCGGSVSQSA